MKHYDYKGCLAGNINFVLGGTAAAITTPLDVIRTRIMLADKRLVGTDELKVTRMMKTVYNERGVKGLFRGFVPRVVWITLGGYIFFGMYDFSKRLCQGYLLASDFDPL